jgi:hypothetical protein
MFAGFQRMLQKFTGFETEARSKAVPWMRLMTSQGGEP